MALTRFIGNFIHGAGGKVLYHPFNGTLDRNFLIDEGSGGVIFVALSSTVFPRGAGEQTVTVRYSSKEEDYTSLVLLKNGQTSHDGTPVKGTFDITVNESNDPIAYSVQMKKGSKVISTSKEIIIEFVDNVYFGLVDHEEDILENLNETWIKEHFTSKIASPSNIIFNNLESEYQLFTFIVPKVYGTEFVYISGYEGNSMEFDYTDSFNKIGEVTIDGVAYNVYIIDTQAQYKNYTFKVVF